MLQEVGRQDCIDGLPGRRVSRGFPDSNLGIALRDQLLRFLLLEKILQSQFGFDGLLDDPRILDVANDEADQREGRPVEVLLKVLLDLPTTTARLAPTWRLSYC